MAAKRETRTEDINEEVISKHNDLVYHLSVQIVEDDFQSLIDLFKDCPLTPKDLIHITTIQELFVKLKKNENISIGHYEYLTERLEKVDKSLASYVRKEEQEIRDILNAGRSPTKRLRTEQECIKPANSAVVRFNLPIVKSESKCCIAIGNTGIIRCQILGEVGRVLWKKRRDADEHFNDIAIDNNKYIGGSVASPSLVIEPVSEEDAGKYICQAVNSAGVAQSAEIEVRVTKDNVSVMPAMFNQLMEVVQSTHTNLHLTLIDTVNNSNIGKNGLLVNQGGNDSDETELLDILAEKSSAAQDVVKRYVEPFGKISDFIICCQPDIREIRVQCTIRKGEPNSTLRDILETQISTALKVDKRIVNIELIKHCIIISFDITGAKFPWEMSALTLAERFRSGVEDGSISLTDESGHALSICKDSTRIELKDTSDKADKPGPGVPLVSIGQSGYMMTAGGISVLKCTALSSVPVTSVRWFRINKEDGTTTAIEIDNNKYFGGSTESPSLV
ncbi:uncharacterized protein [Argopecten irradians]|uniref:uncharacterized protein n=1 Tax=Argopecten irradians TaxID=31199 RepID=UPI003718F496